MWEGGIRIYGTPEVHNNFPGIDRYIEIEYWNLSWARSDLGLTWILLLGWLDLRLMGLWLAFSSNFVCSNFRPGQMGFKLAHKVINSTCAFFCNWAYTRSIVLTNSCFWAHGPVIHLTPLNNIIKAHLKSPYLNPVAVNGIEPSWAAVQLFSYEHPDFNVKWPLHQRERM